MQNLYAVTFFYNDKTMTMTVVASSQVDAALTIERMFTGANVLSVMLK